jgi:hypothetical protein
MAYFLVEKNLFKPKLLHMKTYQKIMLLLFLSSTMHINAQKDSIEIDYLNKQYLSGHLNATQYQQVIKVWYGAVNYVKGYPELPFSYELQDIKYVFYFTFDSLDKNIIYNRILEWMSLKYSNLASIIDYQDYDLGKIIIKARNPIKAYRSDRLFYLITYRFTLLENRVKLEIFQLSFDYEYNKYPMGETTFYNYLINDPIRNYYPITKLTAGYWQEYMQILKTTHDDIEGNAMKLEEFIRNINDDYNF